MRKKTRIRIDNKITVPLDGLPEELTTVLKQRLIFKNPAFQARIRFGKTRRGESPWIFALWQSEDGKSLILPRGFARSLVTIFHGMRLILEFVDRTRIPREVDFSFRGSLSFHQQEAYQSLRPYRFGILQGGMGLGKKAVSLKLACLRRVPIFVVVKTRRQMHQWGSLVRHHVMDSDDHLGFIGDGRKDLDRNITIAIDRSVYRYIPDIVSKIGFMIFDECQRMNVKIFYKIALASDCAYMLGLSCSKRNDGLDRLMRAFIGPVRYEMKRPEKPDLCTPQPTLVVRKTSFRFEYRENFGELISSLIKNQERNEMIIEDVLQQIASSAVRGLVVSERVEHLEFLQNLLERNYKSGRILNSRVSSSRKQKIIEDFHRGTFQVVFITKRSLNEINFGPVNAVFMVCPMKVGEHMSQIIANLLALPAATPGRLYDYLDANVQALKAAFVRRCKFYRLINLQIENP